MNIKLEQYKIFNECASSLSFSKAARNLFISQSAVSQCINQLEKELHSQLFIRKPKGVVLTQAGELLYEKVNAAIQLITAAENQLSNLLVLEDGELRIGAGDTFSEHYLKHFIADFHKKYPLVKIKLLNRTSLEILDLLKNGLIDLGFVNTHISDDSIVVKGCLTIHPIFVSKNNLNKIYSYQELSKLPMVLLEKSANSRRFIEQHFAKHGIKLEPIIELGSHNLLIEFTKENLGISCVIKEFATKELVNQELFEISIKEPLPSRSIDYIYEARRSLPHAASKFIEFLNDNLESLHYE